MVTNDWVWAVEAESWGHLKEVGWVGGAGKHQGPGPLCGAEGGCQSSEWGRGGQAFRAVRFRGDGPEAGHTQSAGPGQSSDELPPVETDLRARQPALDQGAAPKSRPKAGGTRPGGQSRAKVSWWGQEARWSGAQETPPGAWQIGPAYGSWPTVAEESRRRQPGLGGAWGQVDQTDSRGI